jgi:hypothetical protein
MTETKNPSNESQAQAQLIHVTFFRDEYAFTKTTKDLAIWELRDLILNTSANAKTDLQLLKLAWFGDTPSQKIVYAMTPMCRRFPALLVSTMPEQCRLTKR